MTTIELTTTAVGKPTAPPRLDEAQLAAAAFLARYSGRTLEAYRHDLRGFFQWAADHGLDVLGRDPAPHRAVPRGDGGTRPGGVDDRSAPVDGVRLLPVRPHRRPHRRRTPPSTCADPRSTRRTPRAWTAASSACSCSPPSTSTDAHAALAVLLGLNGLRVSEACATNIEDLGFERGHRTLRILGKGNKPAMIPLVPRTARTDRPGRRRTQRRTDPAPPRRRNASTAAPPTAGSDRSASEPGSAPSTRTCCAPRSSWPPSTPASRYATSRLAARHADPRTTTIYDRRRQNFDRHAAYVVVAFVAGG